MTLRLPDRPLDLVVRGGTVVNADGRQRADVGVRDGRIAEVGEGLAGARVIDARDCLVLPGGIDPHVHLNMERLDPDEPNWADDYLSGSEAALRGGVTSLGSMSFVMPWETIAERIRKETALVAEQAIADVFFHAAIFSPTPEIVAEARTAVAGGQTSLKFFMSLPTFEAFAGPFATLMQVAGAAGGIAFIHCEDLPTIECCTALLAGRAALGMEHFAESRPVESETIAVDRAIAMCRATGTPTYVVHLSSARALAACAAARTEGLPVFVETRPLYLFLTEERYREPEGALYVAQPPLRAAADRDALWRGLADGTIDTLGSDHAPWTRAHKLDPKLDVAHSRSGVAELDTMLPLFFTEAVLAGRIAAERFVALTSSHAARLCGLYPRKGRIAPGSDADLVVWETGERRTIRDAELLSRAGHSVYAGRQIGAWPRVTIRRGEVVFEDGRVVGRPGSGRPIARGPTQRL